MKNRTKIKSYNDNNTKIKRPETKNTHTKYTNTNTILHITAVAVEHDFGYGQLEQREPTRGFDHRQGGSLTK